MSTQGERGTRGEHSGGETDPQRSGTQRAHHADGADPQRSGTQLSHYADGADPQRSGTQRAHHAGGAEAQRTTRDPRDYDFYELYAFDVDCVPRGRIVDRRHFEEVEQNSGLRTHAAICYYKNDGKPLHHNALSVRRDGGVCLLKPDMSTLTGAHTHGAAAGEPRVAQIICDPTVCGSGDNQSNEEDWTSPRTVARLQVKNLLDSQYTIHYCFEMRFMLSKLQDGSPVDNESNWGDMRKLMKYEAMMLEFMDSMREMGVFCDTVLLTAGPSQFEFGLTFDKDLKGADMAARFRKEVTLFFENKGFLASFLLRDESKGDKKFPLPMHMNHYLKALNGENVFNDGPLGISTIARQWLAGICFHLPALMAFYWPTENCYINISCCSEERTQSPPVYGKHDRRSYFRRKQDGNKIYLENRLPCSTSNPYLVLAGTIAAGLHGIKNELEFNERKRPDMPKSLPVALEKLEGDEYLSKQLGEDFVTCFIAKKRKDLSKRPPTRNQYYKKQCSRVLSFCTLGLLFYFIFVGFFPEYDYPSRILRPNSE